MTPLLHGRPIHQAIRRLDVGGKILTNHLKELVSIRHYNMMDETYLMNEVKEAVSYVSLDFSGDLHRTWKGGIGEQRRQPDPSILVDYILPDYDAHKAGYMRGHSDSHSGPKSRADEMQIQDSMTLGNERFVVPEILFNPMDLGMQQAGLPEVIMQSLASVPRGLWASMLANVVVVGGNCQIRGFLERLYVHLPKETIIGFDLGRRKKANDIRFDLEIERKNYEKSHPQNV